MGNIYLYVVRFESNDTSAPDGAAPSGSVTLAYADVGDYTLTFDAGIKPKVIHAAWGYFEENDPTLHCRFTGYTASTGVALLMSYEEDGTSGISASADSDDKTLVFCFLCNRSDLGD